MSNCRLVKVEAAQLPISGEHVVVFQFKFGEPEEQVVSVSFNDWLPAHEVAARLRSLAASIEERLT